MAALRSPDLLKPHPRLGPDGGLIPALSHEEYAGLKESIRANGMMQPIVVDHPSMVILDGHHRWLAAKEIGLEQVPIMVQETGTEESNLALGISLNRDRRHMTGEHKRALAAALLTANPAQSDRAVAAAVGVSHTLVGDIRDDMEQEGQLVPGTSSIGLDGKERKRPRPTGSRKDRRTTARKPKVETPEDMAAALVKAAEKHTEGTTGGGNTEAPRPDMSENVPADGQTASGGSRSPSPASRDAGRSTVAPSSSVPPTEADGGVDTLPEHEAEASNPRDPEGAGEPVSSGSAEPRASSAEGGVVLFVRALEPSDLPDPDDLEGMADEGNNILDTPGEWGATSRDSGEVWCALRPLFIGRPKPEMVVSLVAYMDDSRGPWCPRGSDGQRVALHAIGGYLGHLYAWDNIFAVRWRKLLDSAPHKIEEYKASDIRRAGRKGPYEEWTEEEGREFSRRAVEELIDRRYAFFGAAAVIATPQAEDEAEALDRENAFLGFAMAQVIASFCKYALSVGSGRPEPIEFVADCQPGMEGRLTDIWNTQRHAVMDDWYPADLSRLNFRDSKKLAALQAADVLAYEARKDFKDRIDRPRCSMSMALRRMIDAHPTVCWASNEEYIGALLRAEKGDTKLPTILFHSPGVVAAQANLMLDGRPVGPPLPVRPLALE